VEELQARHPRIVIVHRILVQLLREKIRRRATRAQPEE